MHATCGGSKAQIHAEARAGMQDKHHQAVSIPSWLADSKRWERRGAEEEGRKHSVEGRGSSGSGAPGGMEVAQQDGASAARSREGKGGATLARVYVGASVEEIWAVHFCLPDPTVMKQPPRWDTCTVGSLPHRDRMAHANLGVCVISQNMTGFFWKNNWRGVPNFSAILWRLSKPIYVLSRMQCRRFKLEFTSCNDFARKDHHWSILIEQDM